MRPVTRRPFTPREYQTPAIDFLLDTPRCALWASMGLGKSVSTLTALHLLALTESQPTLVLAPRRVALSTWPNEAKKWEHLSGLDISPVIGTAEERIAALKWDAPIYSMNFDNLPWLVEHLAGRWPFATVVADEATRLKSFRGSEQESKNGNKFLRITGGKRAGVLGRIAHKHVKRFWQLTGTPSPNGLLDLWGQMWFIDQGARLGRTFSAFQDRWFSWERRPDAESAYEVDLIPKPHAEKEIHERLRDVCLSINAKDYFDLADPIVTNVYVDLPAKARAIYREMEKRMYAEIDGRSVEAVNGAAKSMKCLQLANGAAYVDPEADSDQHPKSREWKKVHDGKLEALESIVSEAAGMSVLVAYHFRSDLHRIRSAFPSARELDNNPRTEDEWNAGRIPLLLAHPASAGHGLNLQDGGNIIVYFGHWWNLEERQQILERIGPVRQLQSGHERPVFVYNIIARNTVDEQVIERVESKRSVQDVLMAAMKARRS